MPRRPPALTVALAIAMMLLASGALAQSGDAEAPEAVLVLLRDGVARRAAGDDAGALDRFEAARALAPELGRTRAQIGLVEHALGRWAEAEASLVAALASDDPWIGRHREELLASLEIVRSHLPSAAAATGAGTVAGPGAEPGRTSGGDARAAPEPGATSEARSGSSLATGSEPASGSPAGSSSWTEPSAGAAAGTDREPHALAWIGLATSLAGLAALLPTFLLALDAQSVQQAAFDASCPAPQSAACAPDHARAEARLAPWTVGLDVLWGVVALGGVLAAVGIGLSVAGASDAPLALDRRGLVLQF